MSEPEKALVSCSRWQDIVGAVSALNRTLPPDMRKRFQQVFTTYLVNHGLEGVYDRMNGRTVSQIFAEFKTDELKLIGSGSIDGVTYQLYESPQRHDDEEGERRVD